MPRPGRPRANSHRQTGSISSTGVNPSHSYNNSFNLNDTFDSQYTPPAPIPQIDELPMSPTSRNIRNLKVLHRHDPTIHTVIDQFSLVTMYKLSGVTQEWDTMTCEGPLFIFERSLEPKLGYVVLNRIGLEDYFHYFDASDYFETNDNLLICRVTRPPGTNRIIGLWTQGEDSETNPMKRLQEVMTQINLCLKKGIPFVYPELAPPKDGEQVSESEAMSKLLSRLEETNPSVQHQHQSQQLTRNNSFPPSGESTPLAGKSILAPSLSGASLLSSIFASAAPPSHTQPQPQRRPSTKPQNPPNPTPPPPPPVPSEQQHIEPHSPRPQILTPSIIDAIMGVSPSRASNSTESDSASGLGLGLNLTNIIKRERELEREGLTPTPAASSTPLENGRPKPNGFIRDQSPPPPPLGTSSPPRRADLRRHKSHPDPPQERDLIPFEDDSELWPYSRKNDGPSLARPKLPTKNGEDRSYDADADAEDQLSAEKPAPMRLIYNHSKTPDKDKSKDFSNRRKREIKPIWDEVTSRPHGMTGPFVQSSPSPSPAFGAGPLNGRKKRREKEKTKEQYIPHNSPRNLNAANLPKGKDIAQAQLQQILASSFLTSSAVKSSCDEAFDNRNGTNNGNGNSADSKGPETKHEFVRELLGLIHTDKDFVDELWEKYQGLTFQKN